MGVSLQCYIGPYLSCPNPLVDTKIEHRACPSKECENFGNRYRVTSDQKFCPKCGTEVRDDVEVTERWPRTDTDDLREEIKERLCRFNWNTPDKETRDFWVPNIDGDKISDRNLWLDLDMEGAWPITDTASEILAFQDVFAPEIKKFKETYAPETITVHWGILTAYW